MDRLQFINVCNISGKNGRRKGELPNTIIAPIQFFIDKGKQMKKKQKKKIESKYLNHPSFEDSLMLFKKYIASKNVAGTQDKLDKPGFSKLWNLVH